MSDKFRFERFDRARHKRDSFDCGVRVLNDYLRSGLNQQMKRDLTSGYVLCTSDGTIAGFFTLSSARIGVELLPEGFVGPMRMPLPATLLGRLAVDKSYSGRGLGTTLLMHALRIALDSSKSVAAAVIEVNAKDSRARTFYERFGFVSLRDDDLHMFLPMSDVQTLVNAR